jgi:hypothetical protein
VAATRGSAVDAQVARGAHGAAYGAADRAARARGGGRDRRQADHQENDITNDWKLSDDQLSVKALKE